MLGIFAYLKKKSIEEGWQSNKIFKKSNFKPNVHTSSFGGRSPQEMVTLGLWITGVTCCPGTIGHSVHVGAFFLAVLETQGSK